MSEKYTIGVEAVLNNVNLQKQLDAVQNDIATKHSNIINKAGSNLQKIENQITRWRNTLSEMEVRSPLAFNSDQVQTQRQELEKLILQYQNQKTSIDNVKTSLDSLQKEYVIAKANIDAYNQSMKKSESVTLQVENANKAQLAAISKNETQVKKWLNTLDVWEKKYPQAFASDAVQNEVNSFKGLTNAFVQNEVPREQMVLGMSNINKELQISRINFREAANNTGGFTDKIAENTQKVMQWAVATTAIYGTLRKFREGIAYIEELNKAMTDIQVVTQINTEETYGLAQSYNELANQLGVTTVEVAQGSTEWLRQGETIENTQELLKSTIMLAKLGNMTTAEATEYLISTLNGFNITAEKSMGIVDELINLDNQYATSAAEIALALQRSAASGQQAGVTFEELAAYITTVSSVTRKSASSIGESFKTMFARMQRVKIGAQFDEDGEAISDVEEVLSRLDIQLRDTLGTFRPLGDVLDDINTKWSQLNDVQQSQVAEAIAGVRQRENFLVLMQNYNKVLEAQAIALDSAGLAQERYDIYLNSVEAAANRAKTAWEGMWQATINNESIKFFYNLSAAIGEFIADTGGLAPILSTVLGLFILIKNVQIAAFFQKSIVAIKAFVVSLKAAATGLSALSATTIIGGIAALAGVIWMVAEAIPTAEERLQSFIDTLSEAQSNINNLRNKYKSLSDLITEYEKSQKTLTVAPEDSEEYLVAQESIVDVQNKLKDLMPSLLGQYDEYGNFILSSANNMEELKNQTLEEIAAAKELAIAYAEADVEDAANGLDKLLKKLKEAQETGKVFTPGMGYVEKTETEILDMAEEYKTQLASVKEAFAIMGYESQQAFIDSIKDPDLKQQFIDYQIELIDAGLQAQKDWIASQKDPRWEPDIESVEEYEQSLELLIGTMEGSTDTLLDHLSALESIAKTYEETGQISVQQAMKMIEMGYAEALMIDTKTGAITVNTVVLRQLVIEESRAAAADAQLAYQASASVSAHSDETTALWKKWQALVAIQTVLENTPETSIPTLSIPSYGGGGGSGQSQVNDLTQEYNELLRMAVAVLKQRKKAEKEALQQELEDRKKLLDSQKEELDLEKENLKEQLSNFKEIIDARKEILDQLKEQYHYEKDLADLNKDLSDIENELLQIQYDDSQEANARRLQLEAERAQKVEQIDEKQFDHSIDLQKDALDYQYDLFEEQINNEVDAIEARKEALNIEYELFKEQIDARIEIINDYLEKTGRINQEALAELRRGNASFYQELLQWNRDYGDGIDKTVQALWEQREAILANAAAANAYSKAVAGGGYNSSKEQENNDKDIPKDLSQVFKKGSTPRLYAFHEGGFVGDTKPSNSEVFAKLLKGEYVATSNDMNNFINRVLPNILGSSTSIGNGDIMVKMDFNIQGNLDKSVVPEIEKDVTAAINQLLKNRGYKRNSKAYSL